MREVWRQGVSIAGVEISIEIDREDLLREFLEPLASYLSAGAAPLVSLRYRVRPVSTERADSTDDPGFRMKSVSGSSYRFERQDTRGEVQLPSHSGEPVLAEFEGAPARFSVEAALRVTLSLALPRIGAVFLHSSGVYFDGQAVFFAGPSGAGKSTIASLLAESPAFRGRLGDDLNVARRSDSNGWIAHSTPFAGDLPAVPRSEAPLGGIHFLRQSTKNRAARLDEGRALPRVLRNMLAYVDEREAADRALGIASAIVRDVPCYELEFAREPSVALEVLGKMRMVSDERATLEA
jgi:hypothetical protein